MREEILDINLIGFTDMFTTSGMVSRFSDGKTFNELEERLKISAWDSVLGMRDIPKIATFELPEKYRQKHRFFIVAGNRRTLVAKRVLDFIPAYVYDRDEEPTKEILGIYCRNGRRGSLYELVLEDYLCLRHFL
ncbi:MAG: hypothetical protein KC589_08600 [Nanoarchaeota archaeon]|nr:hypothetical protein [Nanoarchaeota archaeon]MCA9496982.1 hypothetical protein [Nanoarchaeota archaeon]